MNWFCSKHLKNGVFFLMTSLLRLSLWPGQYKFREVLSAELRYFSEADIEMATSLHSLPGIMGLHILEKLILLSFIF